MLTNASPYLHCWTPEVSLVTRIVTCKGLENTNLVNWKWEFWVACSFVNGNYIFQCGNWVQDWLIAVTHQCYRFTNLRNYGPYNNPHCGGRRIVRGSLDSSQFSWDSSRPKNRKPPTTLSGVYWTLPDGYVKKIRIKSLNSEIFNFLRNYFWFRKYDASKLAKK